METLDVGCGKSTISPDLQRAKASSEGIYEVPKKREVLSGSASDQPTRNQLAIELKLGAFKPADKGQMELYLAWLRENERVEGEQNPVGLILCADRNEETVRLLGLNEGPVRVASYLADVLPRKELARKLHDAVHRARARLTKTLPGS